MISNPGPALAIIGFLASRRGGAASRTAVTAALWPDRSEERARHCLATALWRLKSEAEGALAPVLAEGERLRLGLHLWTDSLTLEERIARAAGPGQIRQLRAATRLYLGDFLADEAAEWVLMERERLRCLQIDALLRLAQLEAEAGRWHAAVTPARQVLALEPLREDGHRLLMRAYAETGNRGLALRQYERCRRILLDELDVMPMAETEALRRTLAGSDGPVSRSIALADGAAAHSAKAALIQSRAAFAEAIAAFDRALDLL